MKKPVRSLIKEYFSDELVQILFEICDDPTIPDNNTKTDILTQIMDQSGIDWRPLGPGTNRFGILVDGYVVKIAFDDRGRRDNVNEFKLSKELQPYVAKTYETHPDGLLSVHEYLSVLDKDDFLTNVDEMREILEEMSSSYLMGDVGTVTKNYRNWGRRDNGQFAILDFAHIYRARPDQLACRKDGNILKYDANFHDMFCTRCGSKYGFIQLKPLITLEDEYEENKDLRQYSFVMESASKVFDIEDGSTHLASRKAVDPWEEYENQPSIYGIDNIIYNEDDEESSDESEEEFEMSNNHNRGGNRNHNRGNNHHGGKHNNRNHHNRGNNNSNRQEDRERRQENIERRAAQNGQPTGAQTAMERMKQKYSLNRRSDQNVIDVVDQSREGKIWEQHNHKQNSNQHHNRNQGNNQHPSNDTPPKVEDSKGVRIIKPESDNLKPQPADPSTYIQSHLSDEERKEEFAKTLGETNPINVDDDDDDQSYIIDGDGPSNDNDNDDVSGRPPEGRVIGDISPELHRMYDTMTSGDDSDQDQTYRYGDMELTSDNREDVIVQRLTDLGRQLGLDMEDPVQVIQLKDVIDGTMIEYMIGFDPASTSDDDEQPSPGTGKDILSAMEEQMGN